MVFISRLKLRNFKSFKAADIQLPKTFICFAGPNGSGKSNLCDAIRFAMGETSLRSLRAKKVRDLIHTGSKTAEVTIVFGSENGAPGYEIKRAIREDGKIRYRLDEKKTTRSAVLETLKRHNLDDSGRNTIAQGEVQRIISMNGKERRGIIDSVAGIADFEEKKNEAVRELETVETRIKEARLVLGERKAFLEELEREKEVAVKYIESKKKLTSAKGTLLTKEAGRFEKELSEANAAEEKLLAARQVREEEMAALEARIRAIEDKRAKTSQEIQSRQKTNSLIRKLEELKASCGSRRQFMEDKKTEMKAISEEKAALEKDAGSGRKAIDELEKEIAALSKELHGAEQALTAIGGLSEDERVSGLRKSLEEAKEKLAAARERQASLASEVESKGHLISAKEEEEKSIAGKDAGAGEEEDTSGIKSEIEKMAKQIDESFSRTKAINAKMGELDREMLELKEKASIYKIRASPQLANPALSFIAELIKAREKGIYGTVADLISFDPKYSNAVEAAGGSRLLYVVVDSVDTATSVIERLKKAKAGRATFIPLDSVRSPPPQKSGRYSSVIETVEFRQEIRRAAEYVFAETLLVDSVSEARKLGVGSSRMVTLDGEIFERSGIVSGGRSQGGVLGGNQLRKIEDELNGVKAAKESLMQELYSIREDESKLRSEKAQLEIRMKTIEMRRKLDEDRRSEIQETLKRKGRLREEIAKLGDELRASVHEKERLGAEIERLTGAAAGLKEKLEAAEQEFLKSTEKTSKERADASARVSSLKARIEGKSSELQLRRSEFSEKGERQGRLEKDEKETQRKVEEAKKHLAHEEAEIAKLEDEISSTSKEIERLFTEMKALEEELQKEGKSRGHTRMELERLMKDLSQVEIRKATSGTRLEDIRGELSAFSGFEPLDLPRDELSKIVAEAERILANLGNVNMAAIEMFDKRKKEIEDVEGKIEKLDTEREAILSMISEIEEHKKDAFMEAFGVVSENFAKMFKHVNVGQGHLYLSDPASPFESGLFIKLRRNNQEHNLDSLSGGEKTLVALMFIFALQLFKPAPFYILDEVDAALDKPNSKNLADLVAKMSADSQFIVVSHNDTVMSNSESVIGVTKAEGVSKLVGIKLKQLVAQA
ncbi:MAG TPA: AAA family ATPase [Candidatus Bilamarchaeum sp.]|nr:AAA family ATPase [Candidatus Bilamarchaeum sp.]